MYTKSSEKQLDEETKNQEIEPSSIDDKMVSIIFQ